MPNFTFLLLPKALSCTETPWVISDSSISHLYCVVSPRKISSDFYSVSVAGFSNLGNYFQFEITNILTVVHWFKPCSTIYEEAKSIVHLIKCLASMHGALGLMGIHKSGMLIIPYNTSIWEAKLED